MFPLYLSFLPSNLTNNSTLLFNTFVVVLGREREIDCTLYYRRLRFHRETLAIQKQLDIGVMKKHQTRTYNVTSILIGLEVFISVN